MEKIHFIVFYIAIILATMIGLIIDTYYKRETQFFDYTVILVDTNNTKTIYKLNAKDYQKIKNILVIRQK